MPSLKNLDITPCINMTSIKPMIKLEAEIS